MLTVIQFAARAVRWLVVPPPFPVVRVPVCVAGPAPGLLDGEFPELADIAEYFDLLSVND